MRLQKTTKFKNLLISTTLILSLSTTTAQAMFFNNDKPKVYSPPVSVPFDLTKKGNKVEVILKIEEYHSYSFELEFNYDDPRKSWYDKTKEVIIPPNFFGWVIVIVLSPIDFMIEKFGKKYSKEELGEALKDFKRVEKLFGTIEWKNGKKITHETIVTPIHLTITKLENDKTESDILDEIVENPENWVTFYRRIKVSLLLPGTYRISAEALNDSPEFIGTKTHLFINKTIGGK